MCAHHSRLIWYLWTLVAIIVNVILWLVQEPRIFVRMVLRVCTRALQMILSVARWLSKEIPKM